MFVVWRINIAAAAILLLANPSYPEETSLLAALPNEGGTNKGGTLRLYYADCDVPEECVEIIVSCEGTDYVDVAWGFSLTAFVFKNTEIAKWLTAVSDDNDPSVKYQGAASIVV